MTGRDRQNCRREEQLRREASAWFARLRGPNGERSKASFEAWRAGDPARGQTYDRLMRRWDEAAVLGRRVGASATRLPASPLVSRIRTPILAYGLAAAASLAVVVWIAAWAPPGALAIQLAALGWPERIASQVSQIRTIRLADGSRVVLDTDTELTLARRHVQLLRGRARFDVASGDLPFIVDAGGGEILAYGGVFDVALSAERRASVSPLRGFVDVDPTLAPYRASPARTVRVSSGQGLVFGRAAAPISIRAAELTPADWPSGRLEFRQTPLIKVIAEANRYSRQKIVLEDPGLGALEVSGVYRSAATGDLASGLAAMFSLQLDRAPNGDFILRRRRST